MTLANRARARRIRVTSTHRNHQARAGHLSPVEEQEGKLGLALMLACPGCAGGFFLAIGAAFGATALAIKGFALAAIVTLVLGLWGRNYWRRRNEDSCRVPPKTSS